MQTVDRLRRGGRRRRVSPRSLVQAWWPAALAVTLGLVLALQRWHWIDLPNALEVLVRIVFVMAVAGWILGDFLRFVVWWFWTRQQP